MFTLLKLILCVGIHNGAIGHYYLPLVLIHQVPIEESRPVFLGWTTAIVNYSVKPETLPTSVHLRQVGRIYVKPIGINDNGFTARSYDRLGNWLAGFPRILRY
jgi:hypothetical protein